MPIRICIVAADDELRNWLVEELRLVSWMAALIIDAHATLAELQADGATMVIVDVDRLASRDVHELRERTWTAPVIGVGADGTDLRLVRLLGARLTSRELKQAIRDTLALATTARAAAAQS